MINELFIYDRDDSLFKNILKESDVIEGRYHISPDYGHDLNTNNLDAFLKDPAYGLSGPKQKYPICVLVTPRSRIVKFNSQKWEEFGFSLFFLTTAYTHNNQIKKLDKDTNTSGQHIWYDWQDMKGAAIFFLDTLHNAIRKNMFSAQVPLRAVLNLEEDKASITRVSKIQNDRLNGVGLTFLLYALTESCVGGGINQNITIPSNARELLIRFRVGAPGAPMVADDTELENNILKGKKVFIIGAGGASITVDDGSGDIDFTDTNERYAIKHIDWNKIIFVGGVVDREIIQIFETI